MEWIFTQWGAFADWAANQPVLLQIAIGSFILSMVYLAFVLVINRINAWAGYPSFPPPDYRAEADSTERQRLSEVRENPRASVP